MPDTPATPAAAPQPAAPLEESIDAYLGREQRHDPVIDRPLAAVAAAEPVKPAAQQPAPAAPAAPKHRHPSVLRAEAVRLGMTADEVDDTPGSELTEYVRTLRAITTGDWDRPAPAAAQPAAQTTQPAAPAKPALDWGQDADEVIDPSVRQRIDRAVKPLLDELAELRELRGLRDEIKQLQGFEQRRQAETVFSRIDRMFAGLGPEYEAVFGKGGREELDPAGPEMTRRQAVVSVARQQAGEKGDFAAALSRVAKAMFQPAAAPAQPAAKPGQARDDGGRYAKPPEAAEEWADATVQPPTNRAGAPEPKGENRAARAIADLAARSGVSVNGVARLEDFPE